MIFRRSFLLFLAFACSLFWANSGWAQPATVTAEHAIAPGNAAFLLKDACIATPGSKAVKIMREGNDFHAVYVAPLKPEAPVERFQLTSSKKAQQDPNCADGAETKEFLIRTDQTPAIPDNIMSKAFNILLAAFVLALLLESAFALLFRWRPFQEFFSGRGFRSLILFFGSLGVVKAFDMDIMSSLFNAYSGVAKPSTGWSEALTAMILAGGSSGVNNIMQTLGFRQLGASEVEEKRPEENIAWISVKVLGAEAKDTRVDIRVGKAITPDATSGEDLAPKTLSILRKRSVGERLKQLFFRDQNRMPQNGGWPVKTDREYYITVTDLINKNVFNASGTLISDDVFDANRTLIHPAVKPEPLRFASRAIIDFVVDVKPPKPPQTGRV